MTMKLSDAIRLGSMMKPQAFGEIYSPGNKRTCAIGAAIDAIGCHITTAEPGQIIANGRTSNVSSGTESVVKSPLNWHPFLLNEHACPVCRHRPGYFGIRLIAHLNDYHRLSREAIADYIATIENEMEAKAQPVEPLTVEEPA